VLLDVLLGVLLGGVVVGPGGHGGPLVVAERVGPPSATTLRERAGMLLSSPSAGLRDR
jgi:hypothetical protein